MNVLIAWVRGIFRYVGLARLGRAGAVAMITAVSAPMLLMIVGFAADYGYASYINQCLARAADAATLGAVSQTAATAVGGYSQLSALQDYGNRYFQANTDGLGLSNVSFNLSVVSDGSGGVIATSTYSYNAPASFGAFIGISNIPLSGGARTTARPPTYVNYYILVDTSQSMAIASTQDGRVKLYAAVAAAGNGSNGTAGCVFACHVNDTSSGQTYSKKDNYQIARDNNIELRIDSAVTAINSIISQAQSVAGTTKNIKFALYTLQANPNDGTYLKTVATLSNNYSALQSSASSITVGLNNSNGVGDTDYVDEITAFKQQLTNSGVTANGSGASATSPLNYFFIVSDGVTDTPAWWCHWGHCTGPLDQSQCDQLKSLGTVGVIYTTYAPLWLNNDQSSGKYEDSYNVLVSSFASQIAPSLQACATSSDFYFEANDGPDIVAATQLLFQRTQPSTARITQ